MISTWTIMLTKITLFTILPFSFVFLANIEISMLLNAKIRHNEQHSLDFTREGTIAYNNIPNLTNPSERALNLLVKLVQTYYLFLFSLLSTYIVIYIVLRIYIEKDNMFGKVWMRLFVTILWSFASAYAYHFTTVFFFITWALFYGGSGGVGMVIIYLMIVIYLLGLVYISAIWVLAILVSISEGIYGIQAMINSKALVTGSKTGVYVAIFLCLYVCSVGLYSFEELVVLDGRIGSRGKIGYGTLTIFFLSLFFFLSLVVQRITLRCNSENTVPLKAKRMQMDQVEV